MHVDDHSYKAFLSWIEDCAKTVADEYETVADLPPDNWFPTQHILRVKETPESWKIGSVVQLFVYRWDSETENWHHDAVAFTQGTITPRRFVNGSLFLHNPDSGAKNDDGETTYRMQPGRVLIKAYVDAKNRIAKRPSLLLGEDDLRGQVEMDASWGIGFRKAQLVDGNKFDR